MLINQTVLNIRKKLNEFQLHVNWEIFNIKLVPSIFMLQLVDLTNIDMFKSHQYNNQYNTFIVPRFNIS